MAVPSELTAVAASAEAVAGERAAAGGSPAGGPQCSESRMKQTWSVGGADAETAEEQELEVRRAAGDTSVAAAGASTIAKEGTKGRARASSAKAAGASSDRQQQRQDVRGGISKYFSSKATSMEKNSKQHTR
eukprot:gene4340-4593_t